LSVVTSLVSGLWAAAYIWLYSWWGGDLQASTSSIIHFLFPRSKLFSRAGVVPAVTNFTRDGGANRIASTASGVLESCRLYVQFLHDTCTHINHKSCLGRFAFI
jgi:hypothetical protein